MSEGYDIQVMFMDGESRTYPKVTSTREDGCLVLWVSSYYGSSPVVKWIVPLENVREVLYT